MNLHPLDLGIVLVYLAAMAGIGFWVRANATKKLDSYYLADRNIPWWMLGLLAMHNCEARCPNRMD